jgi:hypothetical protein
VHSVSSFSARDELWYFEVKLTAIRSSFSAFNEFAAGLTRKENEEQRKLREVEVVEVLEKVCDGIGATFTV